MPLDDEPKTEPGYMITVSLTFEQRSNIDKIKEARVAAGKPKPSVRDLVNEALETFIRLELNRRF
jgi:hypothetical protein